MQDGIITGEKQLSIDKWANKRGIKQEFAELISMAIKEPEEAPYMIEKITDSFSDLKKSGRKEVRNAFLRVQIHCSINSDSDPIKVSKQLYITQVLEKLLFGFNQLMADELEIDEKPKGKKKKKKRS